MSGGKKKRRPVRITYSAGEVNRLLKETADDATKKLLLICIVAARDKFDLDGDETVAFADVMQRYAGYLADGVKVSSGLQAGDTVVTEGYQKLYNGCNVICDVQ